MNLNFNYKKITFVNFDVVLHLCNVLNRLEMITHTSAALKCAQIS